MASVIDRILSALGSDIRNQDGRVTALEAQGAAMATALEKLKAEVQETRGAWESTKVFMASIATRLREIKNEPAELEALAAELDAMQGDMADAVVANTVPETTDEQPPTGGV